MLICFCFCFSFWRIWLTWLYWGPAFIDIFLKLSPIQTTSVIVSCSGRVNTLFWLYSNLTITLRADLLLKAKAYPFLFGGHLIWAKHVQTVFLVLWWSSALFQSFIVRETSLISMELLARFRVYTFSCIIADSLVLANHCLQEPYLLWEPPDYHFHARLRPDLHCVCLSLEVGNPWPAYKGSPLLAAKSWKMRFPERRAFPDRTWQKWWIALSETRLSSPAFPPSLAFHTCFLWWNKLLCLGLPSVAKASQRGTETRSPTTLKAPNPANACVWVLSQLSLQWNRSPRDLVTATAGGLTSELSGQPHPDSQPGGWDQQGLLLGAEFWGDSLHSNRKWRHKRREPGNLSNHGLFPGILQFNQFYIMTVIVLGYLWTHCCCLIYVGSSLWN